MERDLELIILSVFISPYFVNFSFDGHPSLDKIDSLISISYNIS